MDSRVDEVILFRGGSNGVLSAEVARLAGRYSESDHCSQFSCSADRTDSGALVGLCLLLVRQPGGGP